MCNFIIKKVESDHPEQYLLENKEINMAQFVHQIDVPQTLEFNNF